MITSWYLDSGASSSMTFDKTIFKTYTLTEKDNASVISASGHSSLIAGRGSIEMTISVRGENKVLHLTDVLHVPSCNIQLISCKDLGRKGYAVSFNDKHATVTDIVTGKIALIAQSPGDKDLYGFTPVEYNLADEKAFSIDTKKLRLTLFILKMTVEFRFKGGYPQVTFVVVL